MKLILDTPLTFKIYSSTVAFPDKWDDLSRGNVFLSKAYLNVLEFSAPENMCCHYIGLFRNDVLVGIALTQMICLTKVSSFGVNKSCLQSKIRDFVFRKFASNVLLVGNNMLTGQNAFVFSDEISFEDGLLVLRNAVSEIQTIFKNKGEPIHIINYKDFNKSEASLFEIDIFSDFYQFEIQPNMIFEFDGTWNDFSDYYNAISKKYRDQYKRAIKKAEGIVKSKLSLKNIENNNTKIYDLYLNVTKNAPFNTFYLNENHFIEFKKHLGDDFLFYGYFLNEELVGFNTLIKNGNVIDTYFLGYSDDYQKEKMLYLNMLYDMIGYSINNKFNKIVFSRTALEIKSSVGAKPHRMFGFIKHNNSIINKFMPRLFKYFEPDVVWQERNPFS